MAGILLTAADLPDETSQSIVRRFMVDCLQDRFPLVTDAGDADLHIHVGTPESLRPEFERSKRRVMYTAAEATRIPDRWVSALNRCDEVWVPSDFAAKSLMRSGVNRRVVVMPHGVAPFAAPLPGPSDETPFTIMWQGARLKAYRHGQPHDGDRKQGYLLEQAFRRARLPNSRLILKYLPIEGARYDFRAGTIWYICKTMTPAEILELDKLTDVFVWPTMGEGFGMPPLEKLMKGIPAFATFWSGTREYQQDFPLRRLRPSSIEFVRFNGTTARMACIDEGRLADFLRDCHAHRQALRSARSRISEIAKTKWDYRNVLGPRLVDAVRRMCRLSRLPSSNGQPTLQ